MRKLFLASLLGATVALGTGCDGLNKLLTPPTQTKTGTSNPVEDAAQQAAKAQELLKGQLQQAAGFSANLQQAAGFGVVLNGPTSALQQAAGLQQSAAYKVQTTGLTFDSQNPTYTGEIGSGELVASGSIQGSNPRTVSGHEYFSSFNFDLDIATASKVPTLQGAHISGQLSLDANLSTPGLTGTLTIASGSTATDVDFTYTVTGTAASKWILTSPLFINGVQHWTHLEVDQAHNGTGWVAKDKSGSSTQRVANCTGANGKWTVKLIENADATQSVDMPWSN